MQLEVRPFCDGNRLRLSLGLSARLEAVEGSTVRATVANVRDRRANPTRTPIAWEFVLAPRPSAAAAGAVVRLKVHMIPRRWNTGDEYT